jgi:hypothetical protein
MRGSIDAGDIEAGLSKNLCETTGATTDLEDLGARRQPLGCKQQLLRLLLVEDDSRRRGESLLVILARGLEVIGVWG